MTGRFLSSLDLRDTGDGRHFILTSPLVYLTRGATKLTVPTGFITDLASIPRALWIILPPSGGYNLAAVVHDYLYRTDSDPVVDREAADRAMFHAMADSPRPPWRLTRRVIYLAVRAGGGHAFHQHPVLWVPQQLLETYTVQKG